MLPLIPWCLEIRLVKRMLWSWVACDSQCFSDQDTSLIYFSHHQFNNVFAGIVDQRMCLSALGFPEVSLGGRLNSSKKDGIDFGLSLKHIETFIDIGLILKPHKT